MTRDHMDEAFAAAVRDELVTRPGGRARAERGLRPATLRTVLVTAVVAVALVAGTVGVLQVAPGAVFGGAATPAPCDEAGSAPFDCHVYVTTGGTERGAPQTWLATAPVDVIFQQMNGHLTVTVDAPVNAYSSDVIRAGGTLSSRDAGGTTEGCYRPSTDPSAGRCGQDGWLSRFMEGRVTFSIQGDTVVMRNATATITLRTTGRAPKTPPTASPSRTVVGASYCPLSEVVPKPTVAGASTRLVPFTPTRAELCRIVRAGNGTNAGSDAVVTGADARELAALLDSAKQSPFARGSWNCPADFGTGVRADFSDAAGRHITVFVRDTGCAATRNGAFVATTPAGLPALLERIAPTLPRLTLR